MNGARGEVDLGARREPPHLHVARGDNPHVALWFAERIFDQDRVFVEQRLDRAELQWRGPDQPCATLVCEVAACVQITKLQLERGHFLPQGFRPSSTALRKCCHLVLRHAHAPLLANPLPFERKGIRQQLRFIRGRAGEVIQQPACERPLVEDQRTARGLAVALFGEPHVDFDGSTERRRQRAESERA